jgi:Kef-type K+ transport system membrane component KefB/mannitol/fructose-specific phosphotransferase system IIA component (Ntr-type)/nucleotide-binding universal stress UspA family protein
MHQVDLSLPFTDPVLVFATVMLIILIVPVVFSRVRIPSIIGFILAGVIVGPNLLGILQRGETMVLLGTVGLLYLMFMAGLEIDVKRFQKYKNHSIIFGSWTFFIPQVGGAVLAVYLLGFGWPAAILLASMFASHTLVSYPIASKLGITKNTAVTTTIGGTIITDTAALLVLAVIIAMEGGTVGLGFWIGLGISLSLLTFFTFWALPKIARWFFQTVSEESYLEFVFVMAVAFAVSFFAELAGVEAIIGAFMAGLAVNKLIPENGTLMNRIHFVGNSLFIPFFLLSVGMIVDVRAFIAGTEAWIIAIFMVAVALAGKYIAAWVTSKSLNYNNNEMMSMYGLSVAQAAATLAVVLVAYDRGIFGMFGDAVLNGSVLMILVTCIVSPIITEKYGKLLALEEDDKPYDPSDAPQRILVPLANPETSDALMDIAFMVRDKDSPEPLYPLTVTRESIESDAEVAKGEKLLSHAVVHAAAAEVPVTPMTRIDLNIASGIKRAVNENRISNVIIGWNGQTSARQRIFGSILDQLLNDIDEMVMVCKIEKPVNTFKRIVVAVPPFSALEVGFAEAIRPLKLMTQQLGADLVVAVTEERMQVVEGRINKIKPELDAIYSGLEQWSSLPSWMDENIEENDLFVLISAHEGSISWRPGLDRLPRVIAQRFPELSFVTVYPSEVQVESAMINGVVPREDSLLSSDRIIMNLAQKPVRETLEDIVSTNSKNDENRVSELVDRLLHNSESYTPEVMPGVLLYEARTSKTDEQMLYVGVSRQGLNMEKTANLVHVILVLVSPRSIDKQEHLKQLNAVVKMIKSGESHKKIPLAQDATAAVKAMMAR